MTGTQEGGRAWLWSLVAARPGRRGRLASAGWLAAILAVAVVDAPPPASTGVLVNDLHAQFALEIALHRAVDGVPSHVEWPALGRMPGAAFYEALGDRPLRAALPAAIATDPASPRLPRGPVHNGENGLTFLEAVLLRLRPDLGLIGLRDALVAVRLALIALFGFAALRAGASPLLAWVLVHGAVEVGVAIASFKELTQFTLLQPALAAHVALLGAALSHATGRRPGAALAAHGAAGFATVALGHLRSSYYGLALGLLVLELAAAALLLRRRGRTPRAAALAAAAAAGGLTFHLVFVAPLATLPEGTHGEGIHHQVFHPLVIGLGVPPDTKVAAAEGLRWDDTVGAAIAKRIDPGAPYLGPRYEAALRRYYVDLWRRAPRDMLAAYATKAWMAGSCVAWDGPVIFGSFETHGPLAVLLRAARIVPGGPVWLALFLGLAAGGAWRLVRGRDPLASFLVVGCALAAAGLLVESAAVASTFNTQYHGFLAWAEAGLVVLALQVGLGRLQSRAIDQRASSPASASSATGDGSHRP